MSNYFWFGGAATPYLVEESTRFNESNISRAPLESDPYQPGQSAEIISVTSSVVSATGWNDAGDDNGVSWTGVVYGNGIFVSVGRYGGGDFGSAGLAQYSYDGKNWTNVNSSSDVNSWSGLAYGNGVFIAAAVSGSNRIMRSTDGINWTGMASPDDSSVYGAWDKVAYGKVNGTDTWIISNYNGYNNNNPFLYSTNDGQVWSVASIPDQTRSLQTSAVTYGGAPGSEVFVAVAAGNFRYDNRVAISTNGTSWSTVTDTPFNTGAWVGVAYGDDGQGGNHFVANGTFGICTSVDGNNWTHNTNTTVDGISTDPDYGQGLYYANGIYFIGNDKLQYSTDGGTTWTTSISDNTDGNYEAVAYGNGIYATVAGRGYGTLRTAWSLMKTSQTINELVFGEPADLDSDLKTELFDVGEVVYQDSPYIATTDNVSDVDIVTSTELVWTGAAAAQAVTWRSVTYGNGLFVAVPDGGVTNTLMTSPDGVTWSLRTAATASTWKSVTYGGGTFVAVANSSSYRVMYSTDGLSWTAATAAEANGWQSVTYGGGKFVAVSGSGTNRAMYSTDGINWTASGSTSITQPYNWSSVTYGITSSGTNVGGGFFVAVSTDTETSSQVMYSFNATEWFAATSAETNRWESVTYGDGKYVAVASTGTNRIMYSTDCINWTAVTSPQQEQWVSVTYGNGAFVAVANGTINQMYSTDGVNWVTTFGTAAQGWSAVTSGGGKFVAVSSTGTDRVMVGEFDKSTQVTLSGSKDLEFFNVGDTATQPSTGVSAPISGISSNVMTFAGDIAFTTGSPLISQIGASGVVDSVEYTNSRMTVAMDSGVFVANAGKRVLGTIRRLPRYQSETDVLIDFESVSDYEIPQSAIFDGTSSYLTNTNGPIQTNVNAFTTSLWIKPSDIISSPDSEFLVWDWETTGLWCGLARNVSSGSIYFTIQTGSGEYYTYTPDGVSSDTSAWQHIVLAVDTNQTNGNDRVKIYIDGILQPKGPEVQMVEGQVLSINKGNMNGYIGAGKRTSGVEGHFDGYIADVQRIDGQALSPLAFGEFNPFGQWIAKDYEDPQLVGTIVSTVGDTQLTIVDSSKFDLLEVGGGVGQDTGYTPETSAITNVETSGWKWIEEFPGVTPETANFPGGASIKDVTYGPNGWVFMTTNGKFAQSNDLVNWNYSDAPDNAPSSFEQVFTNGSRYIAATNGYPPDNLGRRIWANSTDGINWTMCLNQSPGYNNPFYVFGPYIYGACYGNGWYVAVGRPQRVNGQATGYWSMGIFASQNSNLTSAYTNAGDQAETGVALGNDPLETYSSVVFGKDKFVSPGERFGYIQYSKTDRPYPSGDTVNAWALAIGPNQQVAIGKGRVWYDIAYSSELDVYIVVGQAGVALKVGGTAINGSTAEIPMMWSNNGTYWQEVTFSEYQPYDSANYANRFDHVVWDPSNEVFCAISNTSALNPSAYSLDGVNWQYGSAAAVDNANHTADRWDSLSYGNGFILATTHQNDTMYSSSGGMDQELLTLTDDTDLNNLRSGDEVSRIQTYATSRTYSSDWVNVSSNPGGAFDSTCLGCSATVLPNGSWTPNGYTFSGVLEVEISSIPTITVIGDSGSQTISGNNGGVGFEPGNGGGHYWIKFDAQENITSVEFTDVTTVYGFRLDGNYIWDGYPILGGGTGIISEVGDSSLTIVSSGGSWSSGSTVIGPNLPPGRGEATSLNTTNNTIDYTLMSGRFIGGQGKTANAVNTYGTHGYHLPFDPSDIGADVARSNDFTPNNITSADIVVDSPTDYGTDTGLGGEVRGNYATYYSSPGGTGLDVNPLTDGNLVISSVGSSAYVKSTIGTTSGKWYWETTINGTPEGSLLIGVSTTNAAAGGTFDAAYLSSPGGIETDLPGSTDNGITLSALGAGDVIQVFLDLDAGKLWFGQNGTIPGSGDPFTGSNPQVTLTVLDTHHIAFARAGTSGSSSLTANFGQRPFKYQAPAGYKSVTTTNL